MSLHGTLNPGKEGGGFEFGTYQFLYRESKTTCTGGSGTPEPPAMSFGGGKEEVSQELTGLKPGTEYTVCLAAHNEAGTEEAVGGPVTFKTARPPEAPEAQEATSITATAATLHGAVNPNAPGDPGSYQFVYRESATECRGDHETAAPEPPASTAGGADEPAAAPVVGLDPGTTYTFCLIAQNGAHEEAESGPQTFTTPKSGPTISNGAASQIEATEATVTAVINPGNLATTYHLEYGTTTEYGASTPEASAGAGRHADAVEVNLTGLQPETTYHARVEASNSDKTEQGEDIVFRTLPAQSTGATPTHCANAGNTGFNAALPDCRAYELVSAPGAGELEPAEVDYPIAPFESGPQGVIGSRAPMIAAPDGSSITYAAAASALGGSGSEGAGYDNQWVATRVGSSWHPRDITPPALLGEEQGETQKTVFTGFSENLATGVIFADSRALAEHAVPAGPPNFCEALYEDHGGEGTLAALFSHGNAEGNCGEPRFAGASSDLTHIVFSARTALTPEAVDATGENEEERDLYEYHDGQLHSINILPDGTPDPNATIGGAGENYTNAVSRDGTRIFWADLSTTKDIYMRENATTTVQVSAGPAKYLSATANGEAVFYLESGVLWRFDATSATREQLTPDGSAVQGLAGLSETGDYVYFVSGQSLAPGAPSVECSTTAAPGGCNLYLLHEGATQFIATLAPEDDHMEDISRTGGGNPLPAEVGLWQDNLAADTGAATPDGRNLVFESNQPLTGYGRGLEIFVYNAESTLLRCVSCDSHGAGGFLPIGNSLTHMPRLISASGNRVFFDSHQPLTAQDTNNALDVYEWEREGTDPTCPTNTPARAAGGCISLISGAHTHAASYLVESSATGNDVFFTSTDQLVPQADSGDDSLYDARVAGGEPDSHTGCAGSECARPPEGASRPSPATADAPSGNENYPATSPHVSKPRTSQRALKLALASCRRHFRPHTRRRKLCETHAERQHRSKTAATRPTRRSH